MSALLCLLLICVLMLYRPHKTWTKAKTISQPVKLRTYPMLFQLDMTLYFYVIWRIWYHDIQFIRRRTWDPVESASQWLRARAAESRLCSTIEPLLLPPLPPCYPAHCALFPLHHLVGLHSGQLFPRVFMLPQPQPRTPIPTTRISSQTRKGNRMNRA